MTRLGMKLAALVVLTAAHGCAASHDVGGATGGLPLPIEMDDRCQAEIDENFPSPPLHLSCTGLYRDTAHRVVASGVVPFTPQYPLWSDGLFKKRYLYLPEGGQVDASDPNYWIFPIGTRVWKEFCYPNDGDHPVETRLYYKFEDNDWRQTTYEWNSSLTEATRVDAAKDVMVGEQVHRLPAPSDCEECHRGRKDRLLGIDQVSLGQPGSTGLTLAKWQSEHRLINFSGPTSYQIGPDPDAENSAEAHALGWLHVNCGVTCHNERSDSKAQNIHMRLRLDPRTLDGRDTSEFDTVQTTVGQATQSFNWPGQTRIVPGSPDDGMLVKLISQRGDPKAQMPPIASNLVDSADVEWVRTWIANMKKP